MKIRESGMPEEGMWLTFFTPEEVLRKLGLPTVGDVVDFGCGYGTFTIPATRISSGVVHALDLDKEMVAATQKKAASEELRNVQVYLQDFAAEGSGMPDSSVHYVMLFNILHAEHPDALLLESYRILAPSGKLGIMHWIYDPTTPRGPSMDIRPRPEQCRQRAEAIGFNLLPPGLVDLPPYHYGLVLERPKKDLVKISGRVRHESK